MCVNVLRLSVVQSEAHMPITSISPEALPQALAFRMNRSCENGLFAVSMDHSPSEQLTGAKWHTTAILVSGAFRHLELARRVGARLRPDTGTLPKWVNASKTYRKNFLAILFEEFRNRPDIHIFAISAKESTISESIPHCLDELGLTPIYRYISTEDRKRQVQVGPLWRMSAPEEPITFTFSDSRADMCVFIGHFVRRMREAMFAALNLSSPGQPQALNWDFFADKFPGAPNQGMDLLFQAILFSGPKLGRVQWGYFQEGDSVETDLLADNLAGALNSIAMHPHRLPNIVSAGSPETIFYWERWE